MSIPLEISPFRFTDFQCEYADVHAVLETVCCNVDSSNCRVICSGSDKCPFFKPKTGIINNLSQSNMNTGISPGIYKHFKGKYYQVMCTCEHTETGELMVVYQALYAPYKIYCRPLTMFAQDIEDIEHNYRGPRFIRQNFEE